MDCVLYRFRYCLLLFFQTTKGEAMSMRDFNRRVFLANLSSVGICSMVKAAPVATTYPFYAMDTGLRGPDVPSLEKKVALLAKLGFAGIGWTWNASEAEPLL